MKKTVLLLLFLLFLLMSFPLTAFSADLEEADDLFSPYIAVCNVENGVFVYSKNADQRIMPGTTAKLMTALLAYEHYEGRLDTLVTVPKGALTGLYGTAVLDLDAGESISVYELLYAMLVAGMNDCANVLALSVSGTMADFASLMNARARELGMMDTLYLNPTGFDNAAAYTTAADTALLATCFYKNKTLMEMCSARAHKVPATDMSDAVTVYTRNSLLTTQSEYYYKNAEGMISGYTEVGGYAVVTASSDGTYPYIAVAMGGQKDSAGKIGAYRDVKALLLWAGDNFRELKLLDRSKIMAEISVSAGKSGHVLVVPEENVYAFLDADTDLSKLTYSVTLEHESLEAPVEKGVIVGSVLLILDGEPVAGAHLVTKNAVRKSAGKAFGALLKSVLLHPLFLLCVIGVSVFAVVAIYRKYYIPKK